MGLGIALILGGVVLAVIGGTAGGYDELGRGIPNPMLVVGGIALAVFGLVRTIVVFNREDAEEQRRGGYQAESPVERARVRAQSSSPAAAPAVVASRSSASPDEIDRVAGRLMYYLREAPNALKEQRRVPFGSQAIRDYLDEQGLTEASLQAGSQRERDIAALMEKYGDAVRRVPGAEPQDLLFLRTFGHVEL